MARAKKEVNDEETTPQDRAIKRVNRVILAINSVGALHSLSDEEVEAIHTALTEAVDGAHERMSTGGKVQGGFSFD